MINKLILATLLLFAAPALAINKLSPTTQVGEPIPVTMIVCKKTEHVVDIIKAYNMFGHAGSAALQVHHIDKGFCIFVPSGPVVSSITTTPAYSDKDPHGNMWYYHEVAFEGIEGVTLVGSQAETI